MFYLFLISSLHIIVSAKSTLKFPPDFKLGVATSSYQIEGAWNTSDKGLNVWDHFTHQNPSPIEDGSNGDTAADSYWKYKEDVALLKDLGVDFYRFSLSWSRILPTGFPNNVSKDGIQYYKNLLDELHAEGIEPSVTLYHWDHPQVLEDMGGWTNELMVTWFADYARIVFQELGSRIKFLVTINEPSINCRSAYSTGVFAPGKKLPGHGAYLCMHNKLKAHAKAYRIYDTEFRASQGGIIGIVIPCSHYYPKYQNDTKSADIEFQFINGWAAHPIFSDKGDYPAIMKQRIGENSKLEGYPRSRLPEFTQEEIDDIRGSSDFFGLNHYTAMLTESVPRSNNELWYKDSGVIESANASWEQAADSWLYIVPKGFGDTLRLLKKLYKNPPIYVMENGMSDNGSSIYDPQRIQYFHDYLRELLIAVNEDGCNVKGYAAWSFLDNFEWNRGFLSKFGLISVDFQNSSTPRTPKSSYEWYQKLIRTRKIPPVIIKRKEQSIEPHPLSSGSRNIKSSISLFSLCQIAFLYTMIRSRFYELGK